MSEIIMMESVLSLSNIIEPKNGSFSLCIFLTESGVLINKVDKKVNVNTLGFYIGTFAFSDNGGVSEIVFDDCLTELGIFNVLLKLSVFNDVHMKTKVKVDGSLVGATVENFLGHIDLSENYPLVLIQDSTYKIAM